MYAGCVVLKCPVALSTAPACRTSAQGFLGLVVLQPVCDDASRLAGVPVPALFAASRSIFACNSARCLSSRAFASSICSIRSDGERSSTALTS